VQAAVFANDNHDAEGRRRGVFAIAEAAWTVGAKAGAEPAGVYKLGAWSQDGGVPPSAAGRRFQRDFGAYAIADQRLWRSRAGSAQLAVFGRVAVSPADRNLVSVFYDAGLQAKGLIRGRPDDLLGISLAHAQVSGAVRAAQRDALRSGGAEGLLQDYESNVELTYKARLTRRWVVQPDVQLVRHPAAVTPDPAAPWRRLPDAVVVGVRSAFTF
jgi:porin